ncbi:MAG: hypothetical protein AABY22_25800, partial [Nanoarchaeota archaeon]
MVDKVKLKKLLEELSTPEELDSLRALEAQTETNEKLDAILDGFEKAVDISKESNTKVSKAMVSNFDNFIERLSGKLDELKGTVSTSF